MPIHKLNPKHRNVVDLGSGQNPDWAVRHARLDGDSHVVAVDIGPITKRSLSNLHTQGRTDVVDFLKAQEPHSIDELHMVFLLQHLPTAKRKELLDQVHRTLKPGATLSALEEAHYHRLIPLEMGNAGMPPSKERLSPDQIGSETAYARSHALTQRELSQGFRSILRQPPAERQILLERGRRYNSHLQEHGITRADFEHALKKAPETLDTMQDMLQQYLSTNTMVHRARWRRIEGGRLSREAREKSHLVEADLKETISPKPYVRFTYEKPPVRNL
jgi:ubiquinone/menaquinone biosynthesis C-methylase UbiE